MNRTFDAFVKINKNWSVLIDGDLNLRRLSALSALSAVIHFVCFFRLFVFLQDEETRATGGDLNRQLGANDSVSSSQRTCCHRSGI